MHNTSNGPIEFGPVFDKTFLLQLFDLQQQIRGIYNQQQNIISKNKFFT